MDYLLTVTGDNIPVEHNSDIENESDSSDDSDNDSSHDDHDTQ